MVLGHSRSFSRSNWSYCKMTGWGDWERSSIIAADRRLRWNHREIGMKTTSALSFGRNPPDLFRTAVGHGVAEVMAVHTGRWRICWHRATYRSTGPAYEEPSIKEKENEKSREACDHQIENSLCWQYDVKERDVKKKNTTQRAEINSKSPAQILKPVVNPVTLGFIGGIELLRANFLDAIRIYDGCKIILWVMCKVVGSTKISVGNIPLDHVASVSSVAESVISTHATRTKTLEVISDV